MKPKTEIQAEASLYEFINNLPLFRGATLHSMRQVIDKTKFQFLKYGAGEPIITPGTPCTHMMFVISGHVCARVESSNGELIVEQRLEPNMVISPESLYGMSAYYSCSASAYDDEPVGLVQISKAEVHSLMQSNSVFMFNYLNMACSRAQISSHGVVAMATGTPLLRLAYIIVAMSQPGSHEITLRAVGRDLHAILGVTKQRFFATLARLMAEGVVACDDPHEIKILSRDYFRNILIANVQSPSHI